MILILAVNNFSVYRIQFCGTYWLLLILRKVSWATNWLEGYSWSPSGISGGGGDL